MAGDVEIFQIARGYPRIESYIQSYFLESAVEIAGVGTKNGDGDVGVLRAETMQSFRHIRVFVALDDADAQSVRRTSVG